MTELKEKNKGGRPKGSRSKKATRPELKWVLERIGLPLTDPMCKTNRLSWFSLLCWAKNNVDEFMRLVIKTGFEERREKGDSGEDRIGDVAGVLEGLLAGWENRKPRSVTKVNQEQD